MRALGFLFLSLPLVLTAQPYRLVDPASTYLYDDLNHVIRVEHIDSVGGQVHYRNYAYATACDHPDWQLFPRWFHQPLTIEPSSGRHMFVNDEGDSIYWETQTVVGDTWPVVQLSDSTSLFATHDSTRRELVFGQYDSVRHYHLQAFDSNGLAIFHPWNDSVFRLSDAHGMLTMFSPDAFPHAEPYIYELKGMENPNLGAYRLTPRRMYSMPVGGEIHAVRRSSSYPFEPELDFYRREVVARSDWPDSLSVTFQQTVISRYFYVDWDGPVTVSPYQYNVAEGTFTVSISTPDSVPLPHALSGESYLRHADSSTFYFPGNSLKGLVAWRDRGYASNGVDSCLSMLVDMGGRNWGYEGLGRGYYSWGSINIFEHFSPVYYAFPNDTAGTPIDFDSLIALATSVHAVSSSPLHLFPNPAADHLSLRDLPAVWIAPQALWYDLTGRLIHQQAIKGETLDLRSLPAGMYLIQIRSEGKTQHQQRIVKR